jgi:hypothetical protein
MEIYDNYMSLRFDITAALGLLNLKIVKESGTNRFLNLTVILLPT